MIYQIDYTSLYLELVKQIHDEYGIEIPDDWERRVCLGEQNVPLKREEKSSVGKLDS